MPAGISDSDQDKLFSIELLTVQQVADWAKVSPKTIYRWIESGQIPVVKFGNRTYRIPAGAVIEQLRQAGYDLCWLLAHPSGSWRVLYLKSGWMNQVASTGGVNGSGINPSGQIPIHKMSMELFQLEGPEQR